MGFVSPAENSRSWWSSVKKKGKSPLTPEHEENDETGGSHGHEDLVCLNAVLSGKSKEPEPNLFGPDIFGWGGGLPPEGVGAKKFGIFFKAQGNQAFWRDILGF